MRPLIRSSALVAGSDRRDRGAVAVAEQDPTFEPDRLEHSGQAEPRLPAHVIERARQVDALGPPIAGARIGEHPVTGRGRQFLRKVPPQRDAAEPLMQQDDRRRIVGPGAIRRPPPGVCRRRRSRRRRPRSMQRSSLCCETYAAAFRSGAGRRGALAVARRASLGSSFDCPLEYPVTQTGTAPSRRLARRSSFRLHTSVDCHGIVMVR